MKISSVGWFAVFMGFLANGGLPIWIIAIAALVGVVHYVRATPVRKPSQPYPPATPRYSQTMPQHASATPQTSPETAQYPAATPQYSQTAQPYPPTTTPQNLQANS